MRPRAEALSLHEALAVISQAVTSQTDADKELRREQHRQRGRASSPIEVQEDIVERVSSLCLALPEVTVRTDASLITARSTTHSFDIRRRSFCLLVALQGPAGQRLTGDTDWEEIRELVTDSYRRLAPKKLTALLDQQRRQ